MSTYVFMRILESSPSRYDLGMRILTLGRIEKSYDNLTKHIKPGDRVLDIGCGTGAMSIRAAKAGALVRGMDTNAGMLEIAQRKASPMKLPNPIEFIEMGVAELDGEKDNTYDAVLSGLCFSELSEEEIEYTLKQIHRILKPGGNLLVIDEVVPQSLPRRLFSIMLKLPAAVLTYIVAQSSTRPLRNFLTRIEGANLQLVSIKTNKLGNFAELIAVKPKAYQEAD